MSSTELSASRSTLRRVVANSVRRSPICAVVRTETTAEARQQSEWFIAAGLELIEVTFSVPDAESLVAELLAGRSGDGPPFIGMGTVTSAQRAHTAIVHGAEFIVSPNASRAVAEVANGADRYLILGALTATEIVTAWELGADLVKVYPLPPVGGPQYLATVRQPLSDIPMLAGGGFGIEEIPAYRDAGAVAFGIGAPLVGADPMATRVRIERALDLAIGKATS